VARSVSSVTGRRTTGPSTRASTSPRCTGSRSSFVCENNLYGISVCQAKHQNIKPMSPCGRRATTCPEWWWTGTTFWMSTGPPPRRSAGHGPARGRRSSSARPTAGEGHHEGDPNQGDDTARPRRSKPGRRRTRSPGFAEKLLKEQKALTKKKMASIEAKVAEEIDEAVAFANQSEFPAVEEMYEDVLIQRGEPR
jgi:acetoin:2,6-dichlorophenolindophenol oxidoreductase subunit alpha